MYNVFAPLLKSAKASFIMDSMILSNPLSFIITEFLSTVDLWFAYYLVNVSN